MRTCSIVTFSLLVLFFAHGAQAQQASTQFRHSAEIQLSNDTLQLQYFDNRKQLNMDSRFSAAIFLSEKRDVVLFGDLMFPADLSLGALSIAFGPRAYAALLEGENNDVISLSIGAELRLDLNRGIGFALVGHAFYSPDILTFGTADSLTDLSVRAEMRLAPRLTGFAGARWFRYDLIEGSGRRTLEDGVFAGFGWQF